MRPAARPSPADAAVGSGGETALGPQAIAFSGRDTIFDWPVTGAGTLGAGTTAARDADAAGFQPFIAPSDRTVLGGPGSSHAWHTWPLP